MSFSTIKANLTSLEAGWFFVFKEMVGEINFGLDVGLEFEEAPPNNEYSSWDEIHWVSIQEEFINIETNISVDFLGQPSYVQPINWGRNASEMAFITYRKPSKVAYHSINLIP